MASKKSLVLGGIALGTCAILSFPIINLLTPRAPLQISAAKSSDARFKKFSRQLQTSCADCHTSGLTQYPFYFKLPIANTLIAKDILEAQSAWDLPREKLTGDQPFREADFARIKLVIANQEMPPAKYTALHWDAIITPDVQKQLFEYIDNNNPNDGLTPISKRNMPQTDAKKVALGKALFFDKRLSQDNTLNCASCHGLDKGGTDQTQVSIGVHGQKGSINSPTVFNAAYNFCQFWDGRARDLQEQSAGPVTNPVEMGSNFDDVVKKLEMDAPFKKQFVQTYPDGLSKKNITDAIAQYEKTLITPNSPYDKFLRGEKYALTAQQKRGYELFLSNNCASCHSGINMGGQSFEKMGVKADYFAWRNIHKLGGHTKINMADNGRFNATQKQSDRFKFKVPTLRNIAITYPYFHDGSTSDLVQAVQIMARFQEGTELSDSDAKDIAAFLTSTTGEYEGKSLATR